MTFLVPTPALPHNGVTSLLLLPLLLTLPDTLKVTAVGYSGLLLKVTVVDGRGLPVARATVVVTDEDTGTRHMGLTGKDGVHVFPGVSPGDMINVEASIGDSRYPGVPTRWSGKGLTIKLPSRKGLK